MLRESELRLEQMGRKDLARALAGVRKKLGAQGIEDLPYPVQQQRPPSIGREFLPTSEQLVCRQRFSDKERKNLLGDGARIFTLSGTTIEQQEQARVETPSFWHVVNAGDLKPSRKGQEVAIFTATDRFFVDGTFGKDTDTQEGLVRAAGDALADRLGLKNPKGKSTVAGILTDEAATWSDLAFQYLEDPENEQGVWLLGPEYAKAQGREWVYARTKNRTRDSGYYAARVGCALPGYGLSVDDWYHNIGSVDVGGPLLVVPI